MPLRATSSHGGGIFVSYRRQDSRHIAGRLYDRLAARYGAAQVFMDVDSIGAGLDFTSAIHRAIDSCDVVLAVIGPLWTEARDDQGRRRIEDENDLVVVEIRTALQAEKRIVPVLIDGANVPSQAVLPASIAELSHRNALRLDHETFGSDSSALLNVVSQVLNDAKKAQRESKRGRSSQRGATPGPPQPAAGIGNESGESTQSEARPPRQGSSASSSLPQGYRYLSGLGLDTTLVLISLAILLLLASRYLMFSRHGIGEFASSDWPLIPWLLGVMLPLTAAGLWLLARRPVDLALGLLGGAAMNAVSENALALVRYSGIQDVSTPGRVLLLAGTFVLVCSIAAALVAGIYRRSRGTTHNRIPVRTAITLISLVATLWLAFEWYAVVIGMPISMSISTWLARIVSVFFSATFCMVSAASASSIHSRIAVLAAASTNAVWVVATSLAQAGHLYSVGAKADLRYFVPHIVAILVIAATFTLNQTRSLARMASLTTGGGGARFVLLEYLKQRDAHSESGVSELSNQPTALKRGLLYGASACLLLGLGIPVGVYVRESLILDQLASHLPLNDRTDCAPARYSVDRGGSAYATCHLGPQLIDTFLEYSSEEVGYSNGVPEASCSSPPPPDPLDVGFAERWTEGGRSGELACSLDASSGTYSVYWSIQELHLTALFKSVPHATANDYAAMLKEALDLRAHVS